MTDPVKVGDIGSAHLAYRIFGKGPVRVVVEGALSSSQAEWWDFCRSLRDTSVLVYDRAGYGLSSASSKLRTPENIVDELKRLLEILGINHPVVLLGHSQGGLYASLFALQFPHKVRALILLDPLSLDDGEFRTRLTPEEFAASGVDKTAPLTWGWILCSLRLGFLLKGLLKQAPPFYYHSFGKEDETIILKALTSPGHYATALKEYALAHDPAHQKIFHTLPPVPVPLLLATHGQKKTLEEIIYYGGTTPETAEKIEALWQDLMGRMGDYFLKVRRETAQDSSHYIHLSQPEVLRSWIEEVLDHTPAADTALFPS